MEPDPETFRIVEGRPMPFYHAPHEGQVLDTSKLFDEDPQGVVKQAEHNWPDAARG